MKNAASEARKMRERFWGGTFPVDPVTIAKALGIEVRQATLPENVSGALMKEKGKAAVILLHASDHDNRKRFTCAHELGHFAQRDADDEITFVDYRDDMSTTGTDPDEIFANQFAAELLMPADEVRRRYGKGTTAAWELALYFGVSAEAMGHRLRNLGIVRG